MANVFSSFLRDNFTKEGRRIKTEQKNKKIYMNQFQKNLGNMLYSDGYRRRRGHQHHEELNDIFQPRDRLTFLTRDRLTIDCPVLRSVVDKKTKEINRNGIELGKVFVRKCMKEYKEPCPSIIHNQQKFSGEDVKGCDQCPHPDLPFGQEECGETFQTDVRRCTECGFPTRKPDYDQKQELRAIKRNKINRNNQTVEAMLFQNGLDIEKHDNAFVASQFIYTFADNSHKPVAKKWVQSYRGNPAFIRPIISMTGTLGSIYYTCIIHRDVFEKRELAHIDNILTEEYPRCDREITNDVQCNQPLQKIEYVLLSYEQERTDPKYSYIEGEIQHAKKYSPSTAMGVSLIDSLYYVILQLNGQEKWIAEYYLKMRMFKGFMDIPRLGPQKHTNVQNEMAAEFTKWRQDPWYVPMFGSPVGSRGIQFNRIDDSPKELQYIENRDEARKQIANAFGVSNVFMGDTSTGAGLNNEGINLVVTNRDVQHGQKVMDEQLLAPWCASLLDIELEELEYVFKYVTNEEQDLMAEKQRFAIDIANHKQLQEMGAAIYIDIDGDLYPRSPKEDQPLIPGSQAEEEEKLPLPGKKSNFDNVDGMNEEGQAKERRAQSLPMEGSPNLPTVRGSGLASKSNGSKKEETIDKTIETIQLQAQTNEGMVMDLIVNNEAKIKKDLILELDDFIKNVREDAPASLFHMYRENDESGISGTGLVGTGAIFEDGTTVFRWNSSSPSTNIYETFEDFENIHINSHPSNDTQLEMLDLNMLVIDKEVQHRRFREDRHSRDPKGRFSTTRGEERSGEKEPKEPTAEGSTEGRKATKQIAGYTDHSKITMQKCANCRFIQKVKGSPIFKCAKVDGSIQPTGWSKFWKPVRKEVGESP